MKYFFLFNPEFYKNIWKLVECVLLPVIDLVNYIIKNKKQKEV